MAHPDSSTTSSYSNSGGPEPAQPWAGRDPEQQLRGEKMFRGCLLLLLLVLVTPILIKIGVALLLLVGFADCVHAGEC